MKKEIFSASFVVAFVSAFMAFTPVMADSYDTSMTLSVHPIDRDHVVSTHPESRAVGCGNQEYPCSSFSQKY